MMLSSVILCVGVLSLASEVGGHGRLLSPPSRATMWRLGWKTPVNYDDTQLYCGGFGNQKRLGGKCGVCGDPWQGPRDHEAGGKYATGTIVKTYLQGQNVTITIEITANHLGWFEFRLCPVNDKNVAATQDCLDRFLLPLADGSGTRYPVNRSLNGETYIEVVLPSTLTCNQCVLQWRYHTGNSWGKFPDGRQCTGCGLQEEFYGCSDIAIATTGGGRKSTTALPTTPRRDTDTCSARPVTSSDSASYTWCQNTCPSGSCKSVVVCV